MFPVSSLRRRPSGGSGPGGLGPDPSEGEHLVGLFTPVTRSRAGTSSQSSRSSLPSPVRVSRPRCTRDPWSPLTCGPKVGVRSPPGPFSRLRRVPRSEPTLTEGVGDAARRVSCPVRRSDRLGEGKGVCLPSRRGGNGHERDRPSA